MDAANNAIKLLIESWDSLRKTVPDETDFSKFGYEGLEAKRFDEMFADWKEVLERGTSKTKSPLDAEASVMEARLAKILMDVRTAIDNSKASGNGFQGLMNASFYQSVSEAGLLLSSINEARLTLRKELIKIAEKKINGNISAIEEAGPIATQFLELEQEIIAGEEKADKAQKSIDADLKEIEGMKTKASEGQAAILGFIREVDTKKAELEGYVTSIHNNVGKANEALNATEAIRGNLEKDIITIKDGSHKVLEETNKLLKQSNEKIYKALQDINLQGLAGSFAKQSAKIGFERGLWVLAFTLSIAGLVFVAYLIDFVGSKYGLDLNIAGSAVSQHSPVGIAAFKAASPDNVDEGYGALWRGLLHGLPLALPLIWFGWFAARQSGMLSRIQQDYSYKASTAVAFEGYKKEIAAANDEALAKQLLETAIRNFGENPIRLYEGKNNHAMPVEALLSKCLDEKTLSSILPQLKEIIDTVTKTRG